MNSKPPVEHGQVDVDVLEVLRETLVDGKSREPQLRKALLESLASSNLESVKRAADAFHKVGGDPVSALDKFALDDSLPSDQRQMASRALDAIDSSALRRNESIRSSHGAGDTQSDRQDFRPAPTTVSQSDPTQRGVWIFLVVLAILWPAYSIYRFNSPATPETSQHDPPVPEDPWTDQEVRSEAVVACWSAVSRQLKDPDSVDFPALSPPAVDFSDSGAVEIRGYLHANNGLGLKVRANYLCTLQADRQARTVSLLNAQLSQP